MELILLTPVVNFGEVRRAQLAKSTLLTATMVPLGSFQMLKRQWSAESKATLFPEFGVEDLPLGRTAALVPECSE